MVEYADRLKKAMDDATVSISALSKHMKISYNAVKKAVEGRSKAFTAANNDAAARFLGVSASWLATGRGSKHPQAGSAQKVEELEPVYNGINLSERALSLATRLDALTNELHAQTLYATMSTLLDGYEADQREADRQAAPPRRSAAPAPRAAKPRADRVR